MKWGAGFLAVFVLVAGILVFVDSQLPGWLESYLTNSLQERGVEVRSLRVESIDLTAGRIGTGDLSYRSQTLAWESATLDYTPISLFGGQLRTIQVEKPFLGIEVPPVRLAQEVDRVPDVTGPPHSDTAKSPAAPSIPGKKAVQPPETMDSGGAATQSVPPKEPFDLHGFIASLPFDKVFFEEGLISLQFPSTDSMDLDWSGRVLNESSRLAGDFHATGEWVDANATVRALKMERVLTIQSGIQIDPQALSGILPALAPRFGWNIRMPTLTSANPVEVDFLVEQRGSSLPKLSGEVAFRELRIGVDGMVNPVMIDHGLLLARYADGNLEMDAAVRTGQLRLGELNISGVGLKVSMDPDRSVLIDSDVFTFGYNGWRGSGALRGSAGSISAGPEPAARIEWAFDAISGPGHTIQPASLLLAVHEDKYQLSASPLGIRRATTLWIEEFLLAFHPSSGEGVASFTWFNGLGAQMGSVNTSYSVKNTGEWDSRFNLTAKDGEEFFSGTYNRSAEIHSLQAAGGLPNSWLNALVRWRGDTPAILTGTRPSLAVNISGPEHWLKGDLEIDLGGLIVTMPDGPVFKGIQGTCRFLVNRLPRSDGSLRLTVDTVTTGSLSLQNLIVDWSLPTIRTLRVEGVTAEFQGGILKLDPFTVDPFEPSVRTRMGFQGVDGNAFLSLLGEKRFAIEGKVSGSLGIQWRDGIFYLGEGSLEMDTGSTENRFVFTDRNFLKEQFATMGGIPPELKEPFLKTLLERGIRIDRLSLELLPLPRQGKVSLRLEITGETRSEEIEVPIKGFVINNVISEEDLGELLGLLGPVRFLMQQ